MEQTMRHFPHVPAGAGATYDVLGERITFKITTAASGGAYLAMELTSPPGGGPPLHIHPSAETFLILEGALEFSGIDQGEGFVIRATFGDTVYIPSGVPHTYKTVSPTPAKTFAILAPGDEMERFFAEAGLPVSDGDAPAGTPSAEQIARVLAVAGKQGISFLPPQGAVVSGAASRGTEHGSSRF